MANDRKRLRRIVAHNPFACVQEQWRQQMIQAQTATSIEELRGVSYLLPCDEQNAEFRERFLNPRGEIQGDCLVRPEFLPLPFIGNPEADVWYIQINPGVSELDYYEMFCVHPHLKEQVQQGLANRELAKLRDKLDRLQRCRPLNINEIRHVEEKIELCTPDQFGFCVTGEEASRRLEQRQRLYIDQLGITAGHRDFYPLHPSFETCTLRAFKPHIGSRRWWKSALCTEAPNAVFHELFVNSNDIARDLGDAFAQYKLGMMYIKGHGVGADYKMGVTWLRKAAVQGRCDAKDTLESMGKAISPDQEKTIEAIRDESKKHKDETLVIKGFWLGMPIIDAVKLRESYGFEGDGHITLRKANGCLVRIEMGRWAFDKLFKTSDVSTSLILEKLRKAYPILPPFGMKYIKEEKGLLDDYLVIRPQRRGGHYYCSESEKGFRLMILSDDSNIGDYFILEKQSTLDDHNFD